jgi:hypothetical protein
MLRTNTASDAQIIQQPYEQNMNVKDVITPSFFVQRVDLAFMADMSTAVPPFKKPLKITLKRNDRQYNTPTPDFN